MLQKIKYESIDYGRFEKLRQLFQQDDLDPKSIQKLDLARQGSTEIPPFKAMIELSNLVEINLNYNKINRFDAKIFLKCVPLLEKFDIRSNLIDHIDDLTDLGGLRYMREMDFSDNPVTQYMSRILILENLLYPSKYRKHDPVKILTAINNIPPDFEFTKQQKEELRQNIIHNEKLPEELDVNMFEQIVSKYNHKNTIAKYSSEECPVPRKSRFPLMTRLNGQIITKFDCLRVSGKRDLNQIIVQKDELIQNEILQEQMKKEKRKNQKMHDLCIKRYQKRLHNEYLDKKQGPDLKKEDDLELYGLAREKALEIPIIKYDKNISEVPEDIKYFNNCVFTVNMEKLKQQQKVHEQQKKEKQQKIEGQVLRRRQKNEKKINQKLKKWGITVDPSYNQNFDEDEAELKVLREPKVKKQKPIMNLQEPDELDYNSSQSSISETISQDSLDQNRQSGDEDDDDQFSEQGDNSVTIEQERLNQHKGSFSQMKSPRLSSVDKTSKLKPSATRKISYDLKPIQPSLQNIPAQEIDSQSQDAQDKKSKTPVKCNLTRKFLMASLFSLLCFDLFVARICVKSGRDPGNEEQPRRKQLSKQGKFGS